MNRAGLLLSLMLAAAPISALAEAAEGAAKPVPMTDAELDLYRGGFDLGPDLNFEFGAVVKTFEDGQLALQTDLNLTRNGVAVQQTAGAGVTPGPGAGVTVGPGAGAAFTTAGGTTLIQNVANGQLTNLILNRDSNRTFRQETQVTVVLPGFADVQNQIGSNLTVFHLDNELATQTIRSLGH